MAIAEMVYTQLFTESAAQKRAQDAAKRENAMAEAKCRLTGERAGLPATIKPLPALYDHPETLLARGMWIQELGAAFNMPVHGHAQLYSAYDMRGYGIAVLDNRNAAKVEQTLVDARNRATDFGRRLRQQGFIRTAAGFQSFVRLPGSLLRLLKFPGSLQSLHRSQLSQEGLVTHFYPESDCSQSEPHEATFWEAMIGWKFDESKVMSILQISERRFKGGSGPILWRGMTACSEWIRKKCNALNLRSEYEQLWLCLETAKILNSKTSHTFASSSHSASNLQATRATRLRADDSCRARDRENQQKLQLEATVTTLSQLLAERAPDDKVAQDVHQVTGTKASDENKAESDIQDAAAATKRPRPASKRKVAKNLRQATQATRLQAERGRAEEEMEAILRVNRSRLQLEATVRTLSVLLAEAKKEADSKDEHLECVSGHLQCLSGMLAKAEDEKADIQEAFGFEKACLVQKVLAGEAEIEAASLEKALILSEAKQHEEVITAVLVQSAKQQLLVLRNQMLHQFEADKPKIEAAAVQDALLCQICMDRPRNAVILPCSHAVYCDACLAMCAMSSVNDHLTCPACRQPITSWLRYIP